VYFGDRYGLEQVGVVEEFPGKEPSPRYLADLVALAREQEAAAIFAEPQLNSAAAEALAREIGVGVAVLDPIGGPQVPGRETYTALLGWNTRAMVNALRSR
jgi:zinc transport system substrate-binding protein